MKPKPQHEAAHVITSLDVKHVIGEWHEPHGAMQHVAHVDEKTSGIIYHARLGASGLQLLRGEHAVCIPMETLFAMAASVHSKFSELPNKALTPAEIETMATELATK